MAYIKMYVLIKMVLHNGFTYILKKNTHQNIYSFNTH